MNNPGIDLERWKQLRAKWTELDSQGHTIRVDFQLVAHPQNRKEILSIDVIQHIDGQPVTETVQRRAGEAYAALGIAGSSMEQLVGAYKEMLKQLHGGAGGREMDLVVTMSPTSAASGEVRAHLEKPGAPEQTCLQVDYRHYYVLNALRDRMIELLGERWSRARAAYHEGALEFTFEYS
jgi:hypothetical protein